MTARRTAVPCTETRQRGMAVIVAMLVVAIVAVVAAGVLLRQSTSLRTLEGEQLRSQVAIATDVLIEHAAAQLRDDARERVVTGLDGRWARTIVIRSPLPATLQLHDAQARFNLRNLVADGKPDPQGEATFLALCAARSFTSEACAGMVTYVQQRLLETRSGNGPQVHEDLLLLAAPGANPTRIAALRAETVLLPMPTLLNGNTTDVARLGAALPGVAPSRIVALLAERDQGRWLLNTGDIAHRLQLPRAQAAQMQVGIHSEWFLAEGYVQADQRRVAVHALIWREHQDLGVRIQRMWTRIGT